MVFKARSAGNCDGGEGDFANVFGPGQVDHLIRQAIQMCWMMLPKEKRTAEEVERQMRRVFERALKDHREDAEAFRKA